MQNSDPRDRIVYPIHKLMIDPYNPGGFSCHVFRILYKKFFFFFFFVALFDLVHDVEAIHSLY